MKRAVLIISDVILMEILKCFTFKEGFTYKVIENQLPSDTKVIRMGHDIQGNTYIVLESEEFKDITEGYKYPELKPPIIQLKEKKENEH